MNPQNIFNNEDNNNHDNRENFFPFFCPRCLASFPTLKERDVYYHKEVFSLCGHEVREITHTCCEKHSTPIPMNYACAIESTLVTQMPLPPNDKVEPFDLNQLSVPARVAEIDAFFNHNHEMIPIMSCNHGIISMVPQRVTMDLLSIMGQPMAPIILGQGVEPRSDQIDVHGQEKEAPPHALLALTLALPFPDDEIETTTLTLGPPGSEKELTNKPMLDLSLKM